MQQPGYATVRRQALTGRSLEREVFARITGRLAAADPSAPGGPAALIAALEENRQLWMTIAADLAHPDNSCPDALKAGLIGLAGFVERHTAAAWKDGADHSVLVEINRSVTAGLSGVAAEAA